MIQIDLREGQRCGPHPLSEAQRDALRRMGALSVERADAPGPEALYYLTPGSSVGAFEVAGLSVRIAPKIGVPQLLSLACYALGRVRLQSGAFDFHADTALPDTLALALVAAAGRAFRHGLLHGYQTREEALMTVRGRIRFDEQVRRRFGIPMPVEVRYDEFTDDITANRLVKAAAHLLGRMRLRTAATRNGLVQLSAALDNVSLVEFSPRQVPEVAFDRLNGRYREVVALSRLILEHNAYQVERGTVRAPGLLVDMINLFQDFVTVALREALGVAGDRFGERWVDTLDVPARGERGRVRLRPDLVWRDGSRPVFVGDAKYKRVDDDRMPNADLYQLLAYATALDLPGGMLVYAKGEAEVADFTVRHSGRRLRVSALDLSGDLESVLTRVRAIAEQVRAMRDLVLARGTQREHTWAVRRHHRHSTIGGYEALPAK